ncbi:MAG: D-alanyl-D-alanine carboxypeptidase/D-alanyl-D-alanine-endopeptidase, partial [Bryobacteraceae bacterium]|nr:D-alanyl-D-alanine carboxypeptidase/D-alanyl-D-alanine-endopeptidase [Bryobacteraceae bacterium]
NLSARLLPYNKDESGADPLAALRAMADRVVAQGVRVVEGVLTGDDTAYLWEPFPDGWSVDDPIYEYGAPVSALTMNDNSFKVVVLPGATVGSPATLTLTPTLEYLTIHNRTETVAIGPARIQYSRIPGSRELIVSGTILLDAGEPLTAVLAIDDPALFAVEALRKLLEERGVRIEGQTRAIHRRPDEGASSWTGIEIASHESAPLSQILQVINKVSQNLHTELVLREIARVKNGVGSRSGGLKEIAEYLAEPGIVKDQWNFEDASGLSRLTLVTPLTISEVLLGMYKTPFREAWIATLPVGGVDGTLEKRFHKMPQAERIHAKTGSISHVSALSGYAMREDGRTYVFSVLANNFNARPALIREAIDQIVLALLE